MALSHTFSCTVADGTNTALVRPSDFNAPHTIDAGTAAYGLIPIGGVVNWAGLIANVPSGYLVCDGTSLLRAGTYADLFAQVGVIFGSADGTHFNLPDLRDKFVVGGNQDSASVVKSNIRGSLEQSITATGITLTHDGSVADHTGLSHTGVALSDHPDLSHAALGIADHPSLQLTGTIANQATVGRSGTNAASPAVSASAHAVTWPSIAAITHNISVGAGTHMGTAYGHHDITQPSDHGTAGTVTHSFTPPTQHASSIVPAFLAMAFIIRFA
jgi:microcystin-dependent protein